MFAPVGALAGPRFERETLIDVPASRIGEPTVESRSRTPPRSMSSPNGERVPAHKLALQLPAGVDPELAEHVVQVPLNRARAKEEPSADLRV